MSKPDEDPTADFLADVRPGETPWRVERPAADADIEAVPARPERWRRTKTVGRVAGQAAPYVQAAALIGWLVSGSLDDGGFDYDSGQDS
jgi:hypothetical protein